MIANPQILRLAVCNIFIMGANYSIALSAPAMLESVTHWTTTTVGLLMSGIALLGAVTMIAVGLHSDAVKERHLHTGISLTLMSCAFVAMAFSSSAVILVLASVVSQR